MKHAVLTIGGGPLLDEASQASDNVRMLCQTLQDKDLAHYLSELASGHSLAPALWFELVYLQCDWDVLHVNSLLEPSRHITATRNCCEWVQQAPVGPDQDASDPMRTLPQGGILPLAPDKSMVP